MRSLLLVLCLFLFTTLRSQGVKDVDEAFQQARKLAFSSQYEPAIDLCKKILLKSPGYTDVSVLMARVYYWSDKKDSAMHILEKVIGTKPNEDAYIAYVDMLRWSDDNTKSLFYANEGLKKYPSSSDLAIRKARSLSNNGFNRDAYQVLDTLLRRDKKNTEARELSESIKRTMWTNSITLSVNYDYFKNQYGDSSNKWKFYSLSYSRKTKLLGSVIARFNMADRFRLKGYQGELDMYPSISKKVYGYFNFGYSKSFSLFPHYRFGGSLYRSMPKAFEVEAGLRLLYFGPKPVILYVGSIGKYYKNFWFSLRGTFVPGTSDSVKSSFSQSYQFITRYYTKTANDFISFQVGYGFSPDDRSKEYLYTNPPLKSYKIGIGYQTVIKYKYIVFGAASLISQEYTYSRGSTILTGSDFGFNIGVQRLF